MNQQVLRETKEKVKFFKKAIEYSDFFTCDNFSKIEYGNNYKEKLNIYLNLLNKYRNDPDFFVFGAAFCNGGYFAPDDYLLGMSPSLKDDPDFAKIIFNVSKDGGTIQYFNHDLRYYKEACLEAIVADQIGFPLLSKERPIIRTVYNYSDSHSDALILNQEINNDNNLALQSLKKLARYLEVNNLDVDEIHNYEYHKYIGNQEIINGLNSHEAKIKKLLHRN